MNVYIYTGWSKKKETRNIGYNFFNNKDKIMKFKLIKADKISFHMMYSLFVCDDRLWYNEGTKFEYDFVCLVEFFKNKPAKLLVNILTALMCSIISMKFNWLKFSL